MTSKVKLISLHNIDTYYYKKIENTITAERIIEAEKSKKSRIVSLVAEEIRKGEFILIEKFQYYAALKKINGDSRIPCLVYPGRSEKERLIHILKVTIPLEKNLSWLFYNEHVERLLKDHKMAKNEIARFVNCDVSKINNYTLDIRIPNHIREKVMVMKAKTTVQKIFSSKEIPKTMKAILYEKAILNKNHVYRLTINKLKMVKIICEKHNIPDSLLYNELELEQFINDLLSNNFYLDEHMESLTPNSLQTKHRQWSTLITKYGQSVQ